jgi:hypothetical protein
MRITLALAAVATLALGASAPPVVAPAPAAKRDAAVSTVAVLEQGDWRLEAAHECLKQMLTSEWEGGATDLRPILDGTGFELSKVTVRGQKRDPDRIRFGFEFVNRAQVKSLYWEADCRVDDLGGTELASREP